MAFVKFLIFSTLGTAAWSGLLAYAGYLLGRNFERVEDVMGPVSSAIFAAILIFYVWRQLTWTRRQSRRRADGHGDRRP